MIRKQNSFLNILKRYKILKISLKTLNYNLIIIRQIERYFKWPLLFSWNNFRNLQIFQKGSSLIILNNSRLYGL